MIKERLGVPVRAKARLPKRGAWSKSQLRSGPECRWHGHWGTQRAIATHEAKGFQTKTNLKTGRFTLRSGRKVSLKQWRAEGEKAFMWLLLPQCSEIMQEPVESTIKKYSPVKKHMVLQITILCVCMSVTGWGNLEEPSKGTALGFHPWLSCKLSARAFPHWDQLYSAIVGKNCTCMPVPIYPKIHLSSTSHNQKLPGPNPIQPKSLIS